MKTAIGFLSALALLVGTQAHALKKATKTTTTTTTTTTVSSDSVESEHRHILSPSLGFQGPGSNSLNDDDYTNAASMQLSGVIGVGAEYEYMLKDDFSVGGIVRYYQGTGTIGQQRWTESAFVFGGMAHAYLINTNTWIGYVGSGLTILSLKKKPSGGVAYSPDPALGLPIAMGVAYKFNEKLALGLEHTQILAWSRDVNGWPVSDFMIRLRIAL